MPNFTLSPNMNLPIPTVGVDPGPDWADNLNSSLSVIDQHDHTSGNGVQITPSGISINADFSQQNNNLTMIKSARFFPQSAVLAGGSDLGCLYEVDDDLYYNDGIGNQIRITQSGAVAGTPGSIANLVSPASASYVSADSTFVWESDSNTPANMDAASYILRNLTANSKGLTLAPPNAMGSDYSITLPALPVSTQALNMTTSGTIGTITYDAIGQGMTATGANAIRSVTTRTTGTTVGVGGVGKSASSGSIVTNVPGDLTNLSIVITTSGRPIQLLCQGANSGSIQGTLQSTSQADLNFTRDGVILGRFRLDSSAGIIPCGCIQTVDTGVIGAAGTYTYKLNVSSIVGNLLVENIIIIAYEL